jgi:hypothetical protein
MSFDNTATPALPSFDLGTSLEVADLHAHVGNAKNAYFRPQNGALRWAIDNCVNGEARIELIYADELFLSDEFAALAHNAQSWRADDLALHFATHGTELQDATDQRLTSLPLGAVPRLTLARDRNFRHDDNAGRFDHVRPAIVTDAQQVAAMLGRPCRSTTGLEVLFSDVSVIAPLVAQITDGVVPHEAYIRVIKLDLCAVKRPTETRSREAELAGRVQALRALPTTSELDWIKLVPAAREIFRRSTRVVGPSDNQTYAAGIALSYEALAILAEYGNSADRQGILDVAINSDRAIPMEALDLVEQNATPIARSRADQNTFAERLRFAKGMVWQGNDLAASDY